jgi:hypothetical protein
MYSLFIFYTLRGLKADENSIKSLLKLLNKGIQSINRYNYLDILQLLYSLDEKLFMDDPYSLNIVFKLHIALNNTDYVENYFTRMVQLNAKGLDEATISMMISGYYIIKKEISFILC